MTQLTPHKAQVQGTPTVFPQGRTPAWNPASVGIGNPGTELTLPTVFQLTGDRPSETRLPSALEAAVPQQPPAILEEDWDALFRAVQIQLRRAVGEQLGTLPSAPAHSVEPAAMLVQAIVLDCVGALDQLHAALKQERRQRPTA